LGSLDDRSGPAGEANDGGGVGGVLAKHWRRMSSEAELRAAILRQPPKLTAEDLDEAQRAV